MLFRSDITKPSPLSSIMRMFYGVSGGLKLKVKLNGTTDARVYYVPPATIRDGNSHFVKSVPYPTTGIGHGECRQAVVNSTSYTPTSTVLPLPHQEFTTVYKGSGAHSNLEKDIERFMNGNISISEFEVPNMSKYRFVGEFNREFYKTGQSYNNTQADLGHIIVAFRPEATVMSRESSTGSAIQLEILAGFSDETRVGMNCIALPSYLASFYAKDHEFNFGAYSSPTIAPTSFAGPLGLHANYPLAYFTN